MNFSKYEKSINELASTDENEKLNALRFIKNSVIGNRSRKDLYIKLGIIPRLLEYLTLKDDDFSYVLKVQSVTILGSIAYGSDENVSLVVTSGAVAPLLNILKIPSSESSIEYIQRRKKLIESSARTLKSVFSSSKALNYNIMTLEQFKDLVLLLDTISSALINDIKDNNSSEKLSFLMTIEFLASIIAKCCDTEQQQQELMEAGAIQPLVNIIHTSFFKAQEASLEAIASICCENKTTSEAIIRARAVISNQPLIDTLIDFVKAGNSNIRLLASTCLVNLYRTGILLSQFGIVQVVLPTLVKLLEDKDELIQEKAPLLLADLVKDSEEMQKSLFDIDAITKLIKLLLKASPNSSDDNGDSVSREKVSKRKEIIKENALIAIAAATLLKEECRTQAIEAKVLPHVITGLTSKQVGIRLASCQVAKSLSRSVTHLRTSLVDAGITPYLIKLLYDESILVQAAACGALCNFVLGFSPMKKSIIDSGAIQRFVDYCHATHPDLQLNGVWALNNLLFRTDIETKKLTMDILTFDALIELLHNPKAIIQEQALDIVRNLTVGKKEDLDWSISSIGKDDLLDILGNILDTEFCIDITDEEDPNLSLLVTTLYIIVNMASYDGSAKRASMSRPNIVNSVIRHLGHPNPNVRVAAIWCLLNWTISQSLSGQHDLIVRCRRLKELCVEDKLKALTNDVNRDVRDKAESALNQLWIVLTDIPC